MVEKDRSAGGVALTLSRVAEVRNRQVELRDARPGALLELDAGRVAGGNYFGGGGDRGLARSLRASTPVVAGGG